MSRLIIYPYNLGSNSARELQNVFATHRAKRVRPDGNYRPYRNHVILNWGCSRPANWWPLLQNESTQVINKPSAVEVASNKLLAFEKMKEAEVSIPEFTTSQEVALGWVNEGNIVVARKLVRGSEGRGIEIVERERDADAITSIVAAPLYVKYVKKEREFRIHCCKDRSGEMQVIDIQQKKKRREIPNDEVNYRTRNYRFGWIFARSDIEVPEQVLLEAKKAVEALGLTFGATDVLMNTHYNKAYVVEVNTSPALQGQTLESYKNAILRLMES